MREREKERERERIIHTYLLQTSFEFSLANVSILGLFLPIVVQRLQLLFANCYID